MTRRAGSGAGKVRFAMGRWLYRTARVGGEARGAGGDLEAAAGGGEQANGLLRVQAGLALPGGHLLEGPRARLTGEGEVEIGERAGLAGVAGGARAHDFGEDERAAGAQRAGDAADE